MLKNNSLRNVLWIFLTSVMLAGSVACSRTAREYIIPEDKLVDVLVDMHIADAMAIQNSPAYSGFILDSANYYNAVFSKHGVSKAHFDSTLIYYGSRPGEFHSVYNNVITRLNQMNLELSENEYAEYNALINEMLWESQLIYAIPEMGSDNRVAFEVPVKTTGEYTIKTSLKLYTDDESPDARITAFFWYDDGSLMGVRDSFPSVQLPNDGQQHEYTLSAILEDIRFTHLKGYILDHSGTDSLITRHALVSEISVMLSY